MRSHLIKNFSLLVLTVLLADLSFAQNAIVSKAQNHYNYFNYTLAITNYTKALEQNVSLQTEDWIKLANSYTFTNQPEKAAPILQKVIESPSLKDKNVYMNYGKVLLKLGEYQKAKSILKKFLSYFPNNSEAKAHIRACNTSEELMENKLKIYVDNEKFNSSENDFSPYILKNKLLFCSSRITEEKDRYYWDNEAFINIYQVSDSNKSEIIDVPDIINTKMHEGPMAFDTTTNTLYFTRNDKGRRNKKRGDKEFLLNIYSLQYKNETWTDLQPFEHNLQGFSSGHPAITANGKIMYFVSDRPGSIGKTDIYYCKKTKSGWSEPKNLGPKVNTKGAELFPTISDNSQLYFSSDQLGGLGGLDIFSVKTREAYPLKAAENLGAPFNSKRDDFGLIFKDIKKLIGYFTSNRSGGKGGDDIYFFKESKINIKMIVMDSIAFEKLPSSSLRIISNQGFTQDLKSNENGEHIIELPTDQDFTFVFSENEYKSKRMDFSTRTLNPTSDTLIFVELSKGISHKVEGIAFDKDGNQPIKDAKVIMTNVDDEKKEVTRTDDKGKFQFYPEKQKNYEIKIDKENHFVEKMQVYTDTSNYQLKPEVSVEKIEVNKILEIENIYYEYDKYDITPKAITTLNKVVTILKDNPTIFIELSSHTDQRGSKNYNYELSKKRANAAIAYITSKGIENYRLTFRVYGKSKLAVDCPNGDCDEDTHQLNRRTEFKVISY